LFGDDGIFVGKRLDDLGGRITQQNDLFQMLDHLVCRAHRDAPEGFGFGWCVFVTVSFDDVVYYRFAGAADLIAQIESFILGKLLGELIDRQDKFTRTLVNFKGNYSPCHFEVRCLHREISFQHCEISRFARNDTVAE